MTDRIPSEQARVDGERMLHLLMENVKDYGIFMLDLQGKIVNWNTGAERILGYEASEILGYPFSTIFIPEDVQKGKPEQELALAREKGRAEDERWHLKKNGSRFWASGVITTLFDQHGHLQGFAKILRDITERKRAEEQLAETNQRKDDFLAMLAHELRNPLSPILNVLHIIKRETDGNERLKESCGIVERALGRMVRIVDDLLDISRISRGKVHLRKEKMSLQTAIERGVESARPFIESRKHQLSLSLPPETIWLEADSVRIEQIFVNLLNNAAKYTEPGGSIHLSVERIGNDCVVKIRDDGIGIAVEMLPRIFEMYVQADQSMDRSQGGLGLGLTLVNKLVQVHGGMVEAQSEGVGYGSEFTVRLPAMPEVEGLKAEDLAKKVQPPGNACKPCRILVVDDNVDTAESLAMLLRIYGHEAQVAHTGPKALQIALAEEPDVVLLDIGLPGMDGYQVAERIREHKSSDKMWLIAISGFGRPTDQSRSEQAGFNHHLVKPVDPVHLQKLLEKMKPDPAGERTAPE